MYFGSQAPYIIKGSQGSRTVEKLVTSHPHPGSRNSTRVYAQLTFSTSTVQYLGPGKCAPHPPARRSVRVFPLQLIQSIKAPTGMSRGLPPG